MTAVTPERPTLHEQIRTALNSFFADAHVHARFSTALWNVLQSPEETTTDLTIRGTLVTITAAPGPMSIDDLEETRRLLYALDLRIGSRVFVDGPGLVRAEVAK